MKKLWIVMIVMLPALTAFAQQDAMTTQYVFNGVYINPAYTGHKEDLFVQSYFRSQWVGVKGAPVSYALAADASSANGNVGLGVILARDQIGAQSSTVGYINYAYRLRVGYDEDSRLSFGLSGGFVQVGIDGSKLTAVQANDQAIPPFAQSTLLPDANFGIYYSNADMFIGASATNLLAKFAGKNKEAILNVAIPQPHFYLSGGALIPIGNSDEAMFKPVFLLKDDIKGPTTLDLNGFWLMNQRISIGAFYRTSVKLYQKKNLQSDLPKQNAFGGILEYFATPNLRIGYSYDHSLSRVGTYSAGSHELSVGFYFNTSPGRSGSSGDYSRRCYQF